MKQDLPETPDEPLQYLVRGRVHQPRTEESKQRVYILVEGRIEFWRLECAIESPGCIGEEGVLKIDGAR